MSVAHRPRLATAADLATLDDDARVEVIGGALVQKAAPSFEHGDSQSSVSSFLKDPFQRGRGGPGGWWFGTEVEIELSPHEVYLPDVVGWRHERVPGRPSGRRIRVRPDWVCEVLSPSNAVNDLGVKLAAYHRATVPHYWIVDPVGETLTVFAHAASDYVISLEAGGSDVVRAAPFDALELRVADLFGG